MIGALNMYSIDTTHTAKAHVTAIVNRPFPYNITGKPAKIRRAIHPFVPVFTSQLKQYNIYRTKKQDIFYFF
jgi:hypothetical protein